VLTPHRDLHHTYADANMTKRQPDATGDFLFFLYSLPKNKGGGVEFWLGPDLAILSIRGDQKASFIWRVQF
jgi:hypothetical protein